MAMASSSHSLCFLLPILYALFFFHLCSCTEFRVGEITGWVVPPRNHAQFYNEWASRKRFLVGDAIRFSYGNKDSVMEVNKRDYEECNSTRPNYFANSGDTHYALNRSGFFYFISGTGGHCQKGQRMVIWVLTQQDNPRCSSAAGAGHSCNLPAALFMTIAAAAAFQFN